MFFKNPVICEYVDAKDGRRFFIQKENKTLYLYVMSNDLKKNYCNPIWIANLGPAPFETDFKKVPPMLGQKYIKDPLVVEPTSDIKMILEKGLLKVRCSNKTICALLNPFETPIGFNANIKGQTPFGNDMDILREIIKKNKQ